MGFDFSDFSEEELQEFINSAKRWLKRKKESSKLRPSLLKQKQININLKRKMVRQFTLANHKNPRKQVNKIFEQYRISTTNFGFENTGLLFQKRAVKQVTKIEQNFNKKYKKYLEKLKVASEFLHGKEKSKEIVKEFQKNRNKLLANYQKTYHKLNLENEEIDNNDDYKRLKNLINENVYPEKTGQFKKYLRKAGFPNIVKNLTDEEIFNNQLKDTFSNVELKDEILGYLADEEVFE